MPQLMPKTSTVFDHTKYLTTSKVGRLVLAPTFRKGDFHSHGVDSPFLFSKDGKYFMTYVGWDGLGYRTGMASSEDLFEWTNEGLLIDRGPAGSFTEFNVAMTSIMRDNDLFGSAELKKVNGQYVGTYHAYPQPGYEQGPGLIGICYSQDLRVWTMGEPVLRPDPNCAWEAGGLYKSWLLEHEGVYYLFYNAKDAIPGSAKEQTGVATSRDLVHWERSVQNPLIPIGAPGEFDDIFASDPAVFRDGDRWLLFYYGASTDGYARNGVAYSDDLLNWEKSGEILIDVGPEGAIDSTYAHKPGIIAADGRLFHFYCAVSPRAATEECEVRVGELRGITFAMSEGPVLA